MQVPAETPKRRPHFDDMLGRRFGRLTCIAFVGRKYANETTKDFRYFWKFQCDCGCIVEKAAKSVRRTQEPSCGCATRERISKASITHGMHKSIEYSVWQSIKDRTLNETSKSYWRYGGSGIGICDEWLVFENFYRDMGPRPSIRHSIDRIDNAKGYCKENCRWADAKTQCRNKTNNVTVTAFGTTKLIVEWAEELGVSAMVIRRRLKYYGWSPEEAVSTPARKWCPKKPQPQVKD